MKLTIICEEQSHQNWLCSGFLPNGFCIGRHICSHPCYAEGDLWTTRRERQTAIAKIFNIAITDIEVIRVESENEVPTFITKASYDDFKNEYETYNKLLGYIPEPKIEIEYSE